MCNKIKEIIMKFFLWNAEMIYQNDLCCLSLRVKSAEQNE